MPDAPPTPGAGEPADTHQRQLDPRHAPAGQPAAGDGPPGVAATIDHVAHAVERWEQTWPRYVGALGGRWSSGGLSVGFAPSQLRFGNGARLEVLAPNDWAHNPFLRRYLDRHGPGPHHVTFKVPDLDEALAAIEARGIQPINVDRSDPDWQEAFIHPLVAGGIVVQVAQAAGAWESPAPEGFPSPADPPAALVRATHVVADVDRAVDLFGGLLGGRTTGTTAEDGTVTVVDVAWDAPLGLRLVGPTAGHPLAPDLARWLHGAPGRLHHLVLDCPDPTAVPGAVPPEGPVPGVLAGETVAAVVPPEQNLGLRLVLGRTNP